MLYWVPTTNEPLPDIAVTGISTYVVLSTTVPETVKNPIFELLLDSVTWIITVLPTACEVLIPSKNAW